MKISKLLLRRAALSYARSVAFWLAIAGLMAVQQNFIERELGYHTGFFPLLAILSIRFVDFALLTPPIFWIVLRFPVNRYKPTRGLIAYALGMAPFLFCYALIRTTLAPVWDTSIQRFVRWRFSIHNISGIIYGTLGDQIAIYITIVICAHAYKYFEQARRQELERYELQQALAASELQVLKSQLHPHFLFNTLHGISTLIDTDRTLAKAMLLRLSSLLRAALQHGSSDLIRLDEEISFIEAYLDLERIRLGARLETRWKISPETVDLLVPQMVLQPLVENSILHGIACCREGGWLEITSRVREGSLELQVRNSIGGNRQQGMGLGLKNTRARLEYFYPQEATFSFVVADDRIATATVVIPEFESSQRVRKASPVMRPQESER